MSTREAVAEAIRLAEYSFPEKAPPWSELSEDMRNDYRCMADAAIQAMRLTEERHPIFQRLEMLRRTLRWLFAILSMAAAVMLLAPPAHADGVIDNVERAYVLAYGESICEHIAADPSTDGVLTVGQMIMDDGFAGDSAADIVNASVGEFCPRWGALLGRIGADARGEGVAHQRLI